MRKKECKFGFYTLQLFNKISNARIDSIDIINNVLKYINSLSPQEKKYDLSGNNKMHLFYSMNKNKQLYQIIFESIKYNHRPSLLDKDTVKERENPKTLSEGEAEKTHIVLKCFEDEVLVTIEEHRPGISIGTFVNYLEKFCKNYYKSKNEKMDFYINKFVIPKEDFLDELNKLIKVSTAELYADKQLLGSEYLDFSNRFDTVKDDIIISIKAQRNKSVVDNVRDIFSKFISGNSKLTKIRVIGKNDQGHNILLDTDIIKKVDFTTVEIEPSNGQVKSDAIFQKLKIALKNIDESVDIEKKVDEKVYIVQKIPKVESEVQLKIEKN